jgi:anti-sigma-K factor RskA
LKFKKEIYRFLFFVLYIRRRMGFSLNNEEHVKDLLPAYALDILTEVEKVQVLEHLDACPECRVELRAYQVTTDELALASVQSAPRPAVKTNLMRQINSRQKPTTAPIQKSPWQGWFRFARRSVPAWGLALVIVLAVASGFLWGRLHQNYPSSATPLRIVALANTDNAPEARGSLVISQNGEYGTLIVDNLDALDNDHQYQLWLINDGKRSSGGVFSVNSDGYASLPIYGPLPLNHYQAVGITIEPAGGSPKPTGAKVLGGEL